MLIGFVFLQSGPWTGWLARVRDLFDCYAQLQPSVVGTAGCPSIIGIGFLQGPPAQTVLQVGDVTVPNHVWVALTRVDANANWVYFMADGRELRVPEVWIPQESRIALGVTP